jgi:GNAT superfamily N-acetyltransferase
MFAEMGTEAATLDRASDSFAIWLAPLLENGDYFGFLVEDAGAVVGGIGLRVTDFPPNPVHPESNQRGFISNMYVEPEYRRRGLAQELMGLAEAELLRRGVTYAALQASAAGRPLYEKLGWRATTEMGKVLG